MTESNARLGKEVDVNATEGSIEEIKENQQRQDAFVVFSNEKDLRHNEAIRIKASLYTGIALRVKIMSPAAMENLLHAIDLDSGVARKRDHESGLGNKKKDDDNVDAAALDALIETTQPELPVPPSQQPKAGIINLRFEECKIQKKAAFILSEWLKNKSMIETLGLIRVTFEDVHDFKKITEGMKLNNKLLKISFQNMNLDEEIHGTSIGRVLSDSRTIRELDMTHIVFDYRSFYDMSQAILNERCRLSVLKLRGLQVGEIEGKIIQFILMKNKTIHTLDVSECSTQDAANFEHFCEKLNQFCNLRFLTMEKMSPDLSLNIETMGEALAENTKLEVLILRDNRIKWTNYQNFFNNLMPNRTIQKLNLQKTELSDRTAERVAIYLGQEGLSLADLDISKNLITDIGLKALAQALSGNNSLKFLNMASNKCKEEGFVDFAELLKTNTALVEVSFGMNIISNEGLGFLAQMLPHNKTLQHLDLSRNSFNDTGFEEFAELMTHNEGLVFLDIAKNKDVTDEGSLVTLVDALTLNKTLKTLDLTGLNVRKPFLKQHFDNALKKNITLQEVIGKIPANIIQAELDQNLVIEKELLPLYIPQYRPAKDTFNLALVESNPELRSRLNLKDQPPRLHKAAFKLIRNFDIRSVDFTAASIHDDGIRMLSMYLRADPNLRSIVLDKNLFTDDGLTKLTKELEKNTKLAHLSIKGCTNVTNEGLQRLVDVISTTNTSLFQVDLDVEQFDFQLAKLAITESALNRDIQEKLCPVRVVTVLNSKGDVISVKYGNEHNLDVASNSHDSDSDDVKTNLVSPRSGESAARQEEVREPTELSEITSPRNSKIDAKKRGKNGTQELSKGMSAEDISGFRTIIEVKFAENARVSESFQSAIKAWRINEPNIIHLENQQLSDEHIEKLCDFLANRDMITHLNLRRNLIGNQGAKCIGIFIQEQDNTLTHFDITRNHIGQDGGQVILDALNATTRIIDCQIKYGNPISNKMGRIIDREIKANIQAFSYTNTNKETGGTSSKYELVDKGPDYMRCAIKMAQLQNILVLSLPDNMLALEDARMLAQLLGRNTPLKKLNLSDNQLDADCAALIANSLLYNDKLEVLDMSTNCLGDLGIILMLTPLIRKNLILMNIVGRSVPMIREKVLAQEKDVKFSKRVFKNIDIMTQLQYLGIEENQATMEVYKQIWLLLVADEDIVIKVDNPAMLKRRASILLSGKSTAGSLLASKEGRRMSAMVNSNNKIGPLDSDDVDNSQAQLLGNDELDDDMPDSDEDVDEEQLLELERMAIEKEKERKLAAKRERAFQRKKKSIMCCQSFCCFKDEEKEFDLTTSRAGSDLNSSDKLPSYTQVCCWRFLRSRRLSTKFYTGEDSMVSMENSGYSVFVSLLISFNYLILYAVVIVPFVLIAQQEAVETIVHMDQEVSCDIMPKECAQKTEDARVDFNNFVLLINGIVLLYSMLCETIIICINLKPSNTHCGSYLLCQVLTGLTMRAVILISAQLIAVFIQDVNIVYYGIGVTLASTLVLSQIRAAQIWLAAMKADKNCLMPRVRQNYRICMSTNYLAAATIYNKVSVEATENAIQQTRDMDAERERLMSFSGFADEDLKGGGSKEQVKAKLASKCKCCRWGSPKFYQLIMNDIPLIPCLAFAYIFGLFDLVNSAVGLFLTLLDLCFMIFYLSYDEELSIDANSVYALAEKRINQKESLVYKLLSDQVSVSDVDLDGMSAHSGSLVVNDMNEEHQILITDEDKNQVADNSANITGQIAFDGGASSPRGNKANTSGSALAGTICERLAAPKIKIDQMRDSQNDDASSASGLPAINSARDKGPFQGHVL